jgi:ABC-type phosphate transport system substrate-binding protein
MATTLAVVSWSIVVSAAVGPRINGSGTKSASLLFDVLTKAYRFPRDDVIVRYDPVGSSIATLQSYIVDFNVFERPIGLDLRLMYNISHLPLAGQAIVMAYHLPEFDPLVDPPLALDRATLAAIWSGDIATWNHAAIAALNPDLASRLPPVNITLGYIDDFYLSAAEVVKLSLESFDSGFASEFASRNRTFGLLRFARDGRGRALSDSSPDRVAWVDATPYGLTFVDYVDIPAADASGSASSVRAASIYNRAGYLVEPSVASVQLAMRDFSDRYAAGDLAVEIYDAPGDGSWPLAYVPLVALSNRFVQKDCTRIKELVNFFAWVHTNDAATEAMTALRFAPLDQSLKKRVVDSIDTILCNYAPSFETDYLIGYGAPLSILTTWVKQWSSAATIAAYYTTSSADAVDLQSDFGSDFGVTLVGARSTDLIGRDTRSALPADLSVVPLAGFALVPAYHVPYPTTLPLVLDAAAIAGIYLGTIRSWDHPRIAALNPGVALPPMDIVVIVHDTHSDFNWLLTSWLSDHVPAFAASVGRAYAPRYPVQNITGAFVAITTPFGVDDALLEREGSFAMWPQFGAGLIWRVDTVLPASLAQEGGIIIAPDVGSVEHALGAYVSTDGLESLAQLDGVVPVAQADADKAWPVTAVVSLAYRSTSMTDCAKATALADLLQWTQSDSAALLAAERQGFAVATSADPRLAANVLDALAGIECDGKQVSVLARCISRGTLCSNHGTCVPDASGGKCICDKDHTGDSCDMTKGSSGSDSTLAIALAVGITSVGIVLAIAVCLVVLFALVAVHRSRRANRDNDWEIRYDELDLGESLGSGGYGEVRRAMWKGTDVAVKVMSADVITREMERNFCEEVHDAAGRLLFPFFFHLDARVSGFVCAGAALGACSRAILGCGGLACPCAFLIRCV